MLRLEMTNFKGTCQSKESIPLHEKRVSAGKRKGDYPEDKDCHACRQGI